MAFFQLILLITGFTLIFFHPITSNECVTFTCGGEVVQKCQTFFGCDRDPKMNIREKPKCHNEGKEWKCRPCNEADACNNGGMGDGEELDQQMKMIGQYFRTILDLYDSLGAKNGLKCNLVMPPSFGIKQTTHNCAMADKCGIVNICGMMTLGLCMPAETCDLPSVQRLKAMCETLHKPYSCDTCEEDFCNGSGGKMGGKNNNGWPMMVVMGVVAVLLNLYTGFGHLC